MRLRDMPIALSGRFVSVKPKMNAERHTLQMLGELQVSWRIEDRIAAQDQERFDLACRHLIRKLDKLGYLIARSRRYRPDVLNGVAYIPKRLVERVHQCVHDRRL